jgi:prophage regulatory protein
MVTTFRNSRILRRSHVEFATGYSRSTIYLRISQGLWPKPVRLGARAVGWPAEEVDALNAARIASQSDDQIRDLVTKLVDARRRAGRGE